ncbi:hypothetical protein C7Y69_02830 [Alteromonas sp. KS69]|nr:hypothetical protein C7Y69_02830 [Alteromonas sp. KS69]
MLWALNKLSTQKHDVSLKKAPIGAFFVSGVCKWVLNFFVSALFILASFGFNQYRARPVKSSEVECSANAMLC